ncbi:hypothetical protein Tfer_2781 [Thermincola ferriacetica]|uniref:Uncharacterized protein n=1 Tax=Thermincola ferriacetica TaxID=281456 RepID=A0A0L6VZD4_9FIRM|nr:hypothetical protein [Thermincola ferriacetica]KNZ68687.1 hypothetical protein Tfer_2781 [Thermincola ferriacetica]
MSNINKDFPTYVNKDFVSLVHVVDQPGFYLVEKPEKMFVVVRQLLYCGKLGKPFKALRSRCVPVSADMVPKVLKQFGFSETEPPEIAEQLTLAEPEG